jgi:hypothetical protein
VSKEGSSDDVVQVDDEQGDGFVQDSTEESEPSSGGSRRPRVLRTPKVLDDLNLNVGSPPLKEFLEKLNQESDLHRYAAIAYWIKVVNKIDEVNADHIHTAYKRMKWPTPTDASSPLRQLKGSAYGWMSKGTKAGFYKINHVGEGHVEGAMQKVGMDLEA